MAIVNEENMMNNPKLNESLTLANISVSFAKSSVLFSSVDVSMKLLTLVLIVFEAAMVCIFNSQLETI